MRPCVYRFPEEHADGSTFDPTFALSTPHPQGQSTNSATQRTLGYRAHSGDKPRFGFLRPSTPQGVSGLRGHWPEDLTLLSFLPQEVPGQGFPLGTAGQRPPG